MKIEERSKETIELCREQQICNKQHGIAHKTNKSVATVRRNSGELNKSDFDKNITLLYSILTVVGLGSSNKNLTLHSPHITKNK